MKQKISLPIFVFLSFWGSMHLETCYAQSQSVDTVAIQSMIDSCGDTDEDKVALDCLNSTLLFLKRSLRSDKKNKEMYFLVKSEVVVLRMIGNIYKDRLLNFPLSKKYYQLSLERAEDIDYKEGIAAALFNLGNIYSDLHDFGKSLDYYQKGLKIFESIGILKGVGRCLNAIGNSYNNLLQSEKAISYYFKSLKIQEELRDSVEISTCIGNIADMYQKLSDNKNAMYYYQKGLQLSEKINDPEGILKSLEGMGDIFIASGNFTEAEKYFTKALSLSITSGALQEEYVARKALRKIFEVQGKYKEALFMNDSSGVVFDSISNLQRKDEIDRMDMQFAFDKKEAEVKAAQERKNELMNAEKKRQQLITWSVTIGLLLVVVFSGFIFRSLRITRKQKQTIEIQKNEVEGQKKLVEDHQKEIVDSITYAKRLQNALLPQVDVIKKYLPDTFVLYKPKDIVAGDFYFMEVLGDIIYIAAADCTGHGVPGAMVSVVCHNALTRTVKESGLLDTGRILDKVTELVLETFEKSEDEVKDGMDISLMAIHKITGQVMWSGANNPLWYIQEGELNNITADKQPIGKHDNCKPFTTHRISYKPGTVFYLLTDGYADQFGGPKGKKFKYKQLEDKLLSSSKMAPEEQNRFLNTTFDEWRGALEQVDDVCILGIKL